MRCLVFAIVIVGAADARADNNLANWMIGPVFGFQLSGPRSALGVFGFEGGGGFGPERFNLGFEHRDGKGFVYGELDPWLLVGGTLGVGVDSEGDVHPVLGVWEGIPFGSEGGKCDGWHPQLSFAFGYRYTGVHELYFTVKAGEMNGKPCWN